MKSHIADLEASLIYKIEKLADHLENPSEQVQQDLFELRMLSYRFRNMLNQINPTQNSCLTVREISLEQYPNKGG